jgi:hypothetical protein
MNALKTLFVSLLAAIALIAAGTANAGPSWGALKAGPASDPANNLTEWPGEALYCLAYSGDPQCVRASAPPAGKNCFSLHAVTVPGPWINIGVEGSGLTAVEGDGRVTCKDGKGVVHTIPTGEWWGDVN